MVTDINFENSYIISINCHICKQYFDVLDEYKYHLKKHYENDENKQWLKCDLGCKDNLFRNFPDFVCHIAFHTKNRPFKCDISDNGNKCLYSSGSKSNMKSHWNVQHNISNNKNNKLIKYESDESEEESDSESISESECDGFEENGYLITDLSQVKKKELELGVK